MCTRFGMLGVVLACAGFAVGAPSGTDSSARAAQIQQLVQQIDGNDPLDIQAGIIRLSSFPSNEIPLIQAAAADKSLKPAVAHAIQNYLKLEMSRQAARKRDAESLTAQLTWAAKQASDEYEKFGLKDARWDIQARSAIKTCMSSRPEAVDNTSTQSQLAIKNGCNDPLILYIQACATGGSFVSIDLQLQKAANEMNENEHMSYWRTLCYIRAWRQRRALNASEARENPNAVLDHAREAWLVKHFKEEWSSLVRQGVPPITLRAIADPMVQTNNPVERKAMFDIFFEPWEKAMPDDAQLLSFKGRFYIDYAWDARGGDWAGNVTDDGWKKFGERLAVAAGALTRAWEKAPQSSDAPTAMLKVELGQGQGRDRLELWFKRAMDANPDNKRACDQKMLYLEPKWHGSVKEMIKFAHECFDTQDWKGELPFKLEFAYQEILPLVNDRQQFLSDPAIWKDIQSLYEPYLRANPNNNWVRSGYARFAAEAEKWDVAKKQFDRLGDGVAPARFQSRAALWAMRTKARELGGDIPADR